MSFKVEIKGNKIKAPLKGKDEWLVANFDVIIHY